MLPTPTCHHLAPNPLLLSSHFTVSSLRDVLIFPPLRISDAFKVPEQQRIHIVNPYFVPADCRTAVHSALLRSTLTHHARAAPDVSVRGVPGTGGVHVAVLVPETAVAQLLCPGPQHHGRLGAAGRRRRHRHPRRVLRWLVRGRRRGGPGLGLKEHRDDDGEHEQQGARRRRRGTRRA